MGRICGWRIDWWISGKCGKSARKEWLLSRLIRLHNLQHWIVSRHITLLAKIMHQGHLHSTASIKHRNHLRDEWRIKQRKRKNCLTIFVKNMMMNSKVNWILKALFLKKAINRIARNHILRREDCLKLSNMNSNKEWNILKSRKRKNRKRNSRWNSKSTVSIHRSMTIHENYLTESNMQLTLQNRICLCIREPVVRPLKIVFTRSRFLLITYSNLMVDIIFTLKSMKILEGSANR